MTDTASIKISLVRASTVLIEFGDFRVLTDPCFARQPVAPHLHRAGLSRDSLPPLDLLLVTRGDAAHFHPPDVKYLRRNNPSLRVFAPVSAIDALASASSGGEDLAPGDTTQVGPVALSTLATPGFEGTAGPQAWYLNWKGCGVLFAADLAAADVDRIGPFAEAVAKLGPVHVALLPIGGGANSRLAPRALLDRFGRQPQLVDASSAVQVGKQLGARYVFAIQPGLHLVDRGAQSREAHAFEKASAALAGAPTPLVVDSGGRVTFTGEGDELYVYSVDAVPEGRADSWAWLRKVL